MPIKAISVKLITRPSVDGSVTGQKEIHYLYFLDGNQLVYDLSFNLDRVDESQTLDIAQKVKKP